MRRLMAWTLLVLLVAGTVARAEFIVYNQRSTFEAESYGLKTIDFENLAISGQIRSYGFKSGLTEKGVNFAGTYAAKRYLWVADETTSPEVYDWGSGDVLLGPSTTQGSDAKITATLPAGITAVGVDLMTYNPYASGLTITLANGDIFSLLTKDYPERTFWGIRTTDPIVSMQFTAKDGAFPLMDNFTFGFAAPAPPALLLFAVGSSLLACYQRSRRRSVATAEPADSRY